MSEQQLLKYNQKSSINQEAGFFFGNASNHDTLTIMVNPLYRKSLGATVLLWYTTLFSAIQVWNRSLQQTGWMHVHRLEVALPVRVLFP